MNYDSVDICFGTSSQGNSRNLWLRFVPEHQLTALVGLTGLVAFSSTQEGKASAAAAQSSVTINRPSINFIGVERKEGELARLFVRQKGVRQVHHIKLCEEVHENRTRDSAG